MTAPPLITVLTGQRGPTPVRFMCQVGCSLPECRELRADVGLPIFEACLHPDVAAEATVQPVRRHGVGAGIFFSDIMVPLCLAGVGVEIEPGVGPVPDHLYRTRKSIDELLSHRCGEESWADSTGRTRGRAEGTQSMCGDATTAVRELGSTSPIGSGDTSFTLAVYMVEGRPSRDHMAVRSLAASDPGVWDTLMNWRVWVSVDFITAQVEAGASAAQLSDSWVGSLPPRTYRESTASYSRLAVQRVAGIVSPMTGGCAPLIHFEAGSTPILADMAEVGVDCVGVDWKMDLPWAVIQVPGEAVQGNLDPALLQTSWNVIEQAVRDVPDAGRPALGHVFSLGHGVPPTADPDVLTRIVGLVHELDDER